jgi:hypothetical protein
LTGVKIKISSRINGAANMAKLSGESLARLFGEISPKISTSTVITAVEMVTPALPKY